MEEWVIYKEFRFEAAHTLPHHHGNRQRTANLSHASWVKQYLQTLLDNYLDHY